VALPAATFAEASGTLISSEGRAQRFHGVFLPKGEIRPSWRWIGELLKASGRAEANPWPRLESIVKELAGHDSRLSRLTELDRIEGMGGPVPRLGQRASGRTAEHAAESVHEQPPPADPDAPLTYSMEGYAGSPPPGLIARYRDPGWNSVQALNKMQTVPGGPLRGGNPGLRLLEPRAERRPFHGGVPEPFQPRQRELLVLPLWQLFGSEELSRLAAGIAELIHGPSLYVHPQDARRLGLEEGGRVELLIDSGTWVLPLQLDGQLAPGTTLVPAGFPGQSPPALPAWGRLRTATEGEKL
jgi:NADH-quinone oxidoreductase subunit G